MPVLSTIEALPSELVCLCLHWIQSWAGLDQTFASTLSLVAAKSILRSNLELVPNQDRTPYWYISWHKHYNRLVLCDQWPCCFLTICAHAQVKQSLIASGLTSLSTLHCRLSSAESDWPKPLGELTGLGKTCSKLILKLQCGHNLSLKQGCHAMPCTNEYSIDSCLQFVSKIDVGCPGWTKPPWLGCPWY